MTLINFGIYKLIFKEKVFQETGALLRVIKASHSKMKFRKPYCRQNIGDPGQNVCDRSEDGNATNCVTLLLFKKIKNVMQD